MTFPVDKGVPLPPRRRKYGEIVDTLRLLEPGDSFQIAFSKAIRNEVFKAARALRIEVTTRQLPQESLRVWRTEDAS